MAADEARLIDHDRLHTLWDVLAYHAERTPHALALEFEGRRTTYGELAQAALSLASPLADEGLGLGVRVAYLGKNCDDYFVLLYAAARLGAVLVPLNWRLAAAEWRFIVQDAGVRLIFADGAFLSEAGDLAVDAALPPARPISAARSHAPPRPLTAPPPQGEDAVFQVYTSGTTGRPKGAMLSHRNLLALRAPGYRAGLAWFPQADDVALLALPVAHIAGTAYALFGLYAGACIVIQREFEPAETLALLRDHRITHTLFAPAVLRVLVEQAGGAPLDLPALRYITYGASPIAGALLRQSIQVFGCGFVQMYGMTEAAGGVVALGPEDHDLSNAERLQSAGRAMPGVEVAIVDGCGVHQPSGELGEIVVRSPAVMAGYWRMPVETAEALDAQGWLRTGDIGRLDAQGYLYVLDRAKDMIISGGENIYPAEVENAIFGHPDVADVAVIGVPSPRWGEEPLAVIVPKPGRRPEAASIEHWARERLAAFKAPKRIELVEELPRNAGNKVLRRMLREPFWRDRDRAIQ